MNKKIFTTLETLPDNLKNLTGKNFIPLENKDILFLKNSVSITHIAKIPYYFSGILSLIFSMFFLYTSVHYLTQYTGKTRNNEGVVITFLMLFTMFLLFLLSRFYLNKSIKQQKAIDNGEIKYGLWITPTHILNHDFNEGIQCIAKQDIVSLNVYKSIRPPVDMLIIKTDTGETMRIAANWLENTDINSLHTLIENKIMSDKIKTVQIDYFLTSHNVPSVRYSRFFSLCRFLEVYNNENMLNFEERNQLVSYVNKKITHWSSSERIAEENWFMDIDAQENWEYGVNGITSSKEFLGYLPVGYWLMPLAKVVIIDFDKADLMYSQSVEQFIHSTAFENIEFLNIKIPINDYFIEKITHTDKFNHLKTFITLNTQCENINSIQLFKDWKNKNNIVDIL